MQQSNDSLPRYLWTSWLQGSRPPVKPLFNRKGKSIAGDLGTCPVISLSSSAASREGIQGCAGMCRCPASPGGVTSDIAKSPRREEGQCVPTDGKIAHRACIDRCDDASLGVHVRKRSAIDAPRRGNVGGSTHARGIQS